jgi:hypothetical protein
MKMSLVRICRDTDSGFVQLVELGGVLTSLLFQRKLSNAKKSHGSHSKHNELMA